MRLTLLALCDVSAAFDSVDHNILLQRLSTSFGIVDPTIVLFLIYLAERPLPQFA